MIGVPYLTVLKEEGASLRGDGRGRALAAISGASFLVIGLQMVYPVVLPELRAAYGFGLATGGAMFTVLWLANAAGQLPGGLLADRLGEGWTIVASLVVTAVTVGFITTVDTILALFLATAMLGLGIGLFGVARYTALDDLFPDRAGTTIGIVLAISDAGQALLPPLAGFLAVAIAWQLGFGFTLPLFVVAVLGILWYVPGRTSAPSGGLDTFSPANLGRLIANLRSPSVGYGAGAFLVYMAVWISFTSFYPTYMTEVKGLSTTLAAAFFGLFFAVGIVIKPLSGAVYDRIGIRRTLLVITAISSLALVALPLVEGAVMLAIVTVAIAPILGTGIIAQAYVISALADDIRGAGLGIVRTGGMGIAAVAPAVFGTFAEWGYFDEAFFLLAVVTGLLIVLVLRIPRG